MKGEEIEVGGRKRTSVKHEVFFSSTPTILGANAVPPSSLLQEKKHLPFKKKSVLLCSSRFVNGKLDLRKFEVGGLVGGRKGR